MKRGLRLWLGILGTALSAPVFAHSQGLPPPPALPINIPQTTAAANAGDVIAQRDLAQDYDNGSMVAQDRVTAAIWYQKAADQGDALSQCRLGLMYLHGDGVNQDYVAARGWLQKAADQDQYYAQLALGFMFADGLGGPRDDIQAYKWLDIAILSFASQDDGSADTERQTVTARMTTDQIQEAMALINAWNAQPGQTPAPAMPATVQIIPAKAGQKALYETGVTAFNLQNYAEAERIWKPLAEDGYLDAQLRLAFIYNYNLGGLKNEADALKWYIKAADQGDILAQYKAGQIYATARNQPRNYTAAVAWYRMAADNGYESAQFSLGLAYDTGRGIAQDFGAAALWYRKAANQGNPEAQYRLGLLYELGLGVSKDYTLAADAYKKAVQAQASGTKAQNRLARLYKDDLATP